MDGFMSGVVVVEVVGGALLDRVSITFWRTWMKMARASLLADPDVCPLPKDKVRRKPSPERFFLTTPSHHTNSMQTTAAHDPNIYIGQWYHLWYLHNNSVAAMQTQESIPDPSLVKPSPARRRHSLPAHPFSNETNCHGKRD